MGRAKAEGKLQVVERVDIKAGDSNGRCSSGGRERGLKAAIKRWRRRNTHATHLVRRRNTTTQVGP